jgi:zinc D-Ala-D-Ala carboxypeptidase
MTSPYFTLGELTHTSTGLNNKPGEEEVKNLEALVDNILHPARVALDAIKVNSGYRSVAVNRMVGGAKTSHHLYGMAADIVHWRSNLDLYAWIKANCKYTQLIQEGTDRNGEPKWIHVSYDPNNLKCENLRAIFIGKRVRYFQL